MANSILRKKTREYVYRDGGAFVMKMEYLVAEVMMYRDIMNGLYFCAKDMGVDFYPLKDAEEIIEELWFEMVKNNTAWQPELRSS